MELTVVNSAAEATDKVAVSDAVFGRSFNEPLVHQVVTAYFSGMRQGSRAQKNRSAVRGGGRKPWRQKGTGRARAGTIRSPLWRGGGVVFPSSNQDFSQKVNRKMYRSALCSILSEITRQERLVLVSDFTVENPKTRELVARLKQLGLVGKDRVLMVVETIDETLHLASRNLPNFKVIDVDRLNPVDLIRPARVVFTLPALQSVEKKVQ